MTATTSRNPMISLQGILLPANDNDYDFVSQVVTAFRQGKTFTHLLNGRETPCSIWDYAVGDMVKIRFCTMTKATFYRVTWVDLQRVKDSKLRDMTEEDI